VILQSQPPYGFFAPETAAMGQQFHNQYKSALPFPHIVIDDFLDDEILDMCLREFPSLGSSKAYYGRSQENLKYEFNPDRLSPAVRSLFYSFNSQPFVGFVEHLTGISGLIPDPQFAGGGLHQVSHGGRLGIHADFNYHPELNLERRVNVLIYLNRDWKKEYGGNFEIWDRTMSHCCVSIEPIFNRCVVFDTSLTSFHGNPDPVNHPATLPRRSIALYYYTATWDTTRRSRTTQFKVRPNSDDHPDLRIRAKEIMEDLLPPIVLRNIRRLDRLVRARRKRLLQPPSVSIQSATAGRRR
jgi:hypothetical protein